MSSILPIVKPVEPFPYQKDLTEKELYKSSALYTNSKTRVLPSLLIEHDIDPLIKMAVVHHQFESIHPFYDGNGRVGRILNILYLVAKGFIDIPVIYLSRYIIQNKNEYYRLLQSVRDNEDWESWILYMLDSVETVSKQSIELIIGIKKLMQDYKQHIRSNYKFYSQDLLNNLFRHPYTKIEFIENELQIERRTAAKYLNTLASDSKGILIKTKVGQSNFYINTRLMDLFIDQDYSLQKNY